MKLHSIIAAFVTGMITIGPGQTAARADSHSGRPPMIFAIEYTPGITHPLIGVKSFVGQDSIGQDVGQQLVSAI